MMGAMELRGPNGVRTAIRDHLRVVLQPHVEACREAWGLSEEQLPLPANEPSDPRLDGYFDREPDAIDRWPLLAVVSGRFTQVADDFDLDGEPVYRSTCPVQVFSWLKATGREETLRMRDDFATALRAALLSHINLGSDGQLALVPSTMVTDFSDVVAVRGDRFVGGSYVQFEVRILETLTERLAMPGSGPRDTVTHVSADVGPMVPPGGF